MNSKPYEPIDQTAALASEVVRVMFEEKLEIDCLNLAVINVMSRPGNGFGNAALVTQKVRELLAKDQRLSEYVSGIARRPINRNDAQQQWEERLDDQPLRPFPEPQPQPLAVAS